MDCNHARLLLTFARDHADLDQSEADGLEEHLGQCPECAAAFAAEQRADAAIGKAMNAVPVPIGLKERLLAKLPRTRRSWRRWTVGTVAAAAVLVLAILFTWRVWLAPLPDPDWANVPSRFVSAEDKEVVVEDGFQEKGLPMAFPRQLNFGRLISCSIGEFQDRRVPRLDFFDKVTGSFAHVYVLSQRHFNVNAELESYWRITRNQYMDVFREGGFLYLVVYTGSLEAFKQ